MASFTDRNLQKWFPQFHQPSLAQNFNNNNNNNNSFPQEDFVLFPATPAPAPSHSPVIHVGEDTLNTTPKLSNRERHYLVQNTQRHKPALQPRPYPNNNQELLQQQRSGLFLSHQVPHSSVTGLVSPSVRSLSTSYRFSPNTRKQSVQHHYPLSAPSNSLLSLTPRMHVDQGKFISLMLDGLLETDAVSDFDLLKAPGNSTKSTMQSFDDGGPPVGTVSPSDLMIPAPPSATSTNLSTPSFESPEIFSNPTSPMFPSDPDIVSPGDEWEGSLFPMGDDFWKLVGETYSDDPSRLEHITKEASFIPPLPPTVSPKTSHSPTSRGVSKGSVSGATRQKVKKPLPNIHYDPTDPVAAKRARNTQAARDSRARKEEAREKKDRRISELEKQLEEALQSAEFWKNVAQTGGDCSG